MPRQTYREVAFRQFFELLKTPPISILGYYKNLIRAFNYLFSNQPEKIRYLNKEIRKVELMVGYKRTSENIQNYRKYKQFMNDFNLLKEELDFLDNYFPTNDSKTNELLLKILQQDMDAIANYEDEEYALIMAVQPKIEMPVIEQYMQNSMNLKSFFKEDGKKISQLQIYNALNKLIDWMNIQAAKEMRRIRFTLPMR